MASHLESSRSYPKHTLNVRHQPRNHLLNSLKSRCLHARILQNRSIPSNPPPPPPSPPTPTSWGYLPVQSHWKTNAGAVLRCGNGPARAAEMVDPSNAKARPTMRTPQGHTHIELQCQWRPPPSLMYAAWQWGCGVVGSRVAGLEGAECGESQKTRNPRRRVTYRTCFCRSRWNSSPVFGST